MTDEIIKRVMKRLPEAQRNPSSMAIIELAIAECEKDEAICNCGDHITGKRGICWICHENDLDNVRLKAKEECGKAKERLVKK